MLSPGFFGHRLRVLVSALVITSCLSAFRLPVFAPVSCFVLFALLGYISLKFFYWRDQRHKFMSPVIKWILPQYFFSYHFSVLHDVLILLVSFTRGHLIRVPVLVLPLSPDCAGPGAVCSQGMKWNEWTNKWITDKCVSINPFPDALHVKIISSSGGGFYV